MPNKTFLELMLDTSPRVGPLIIPPGSLESHLGKFAKQLTVWTHDDVYKVQLLGSAIGLVWSGKYVLLCSRHQLKGCDLSDVGLLLPDGSNLITSSGSKTFNEGEHTQISDAFDVAAFDLSEPASEHPKLVEDFFKFDEVPPDIPNTHILAFIVSGYPSGDQKYELGEKNHIGTVRRVLVAVPDGQPNDPALLRLRFAKKLDFEPDGLSGGPAFVIQVVRGEPRAYLGGIVVRAGKTHCHILKSGFLWQFLDSLPARDRV